MGTYNPVLQGPLPGPYLEYMSRIIRYKSDNDPPGTLGIETIYCKDAVANFLGLRLAPPSDGVYQDNDGNLNAGSRFAKRADKGSKEFKILLLPFTEIDVFERDPLTGQGQVKTYRRSTLGLSVNGRVGVATVRQWLMYHVGGPGKEEIRQKIKGMITPSLKTYTWRSELTPQLDLPLPKNPIPFYEGDFSQIPDAQERPEEEDDDGDDGGGDES
ncbi:MAG: hypothetical protein F6J93_19910 [Oscillatoria sp. SIO1A7]|nr:hypothetical protein [Oscillatoria sp. SIO1A7]